MNPEASNPVYWFNTNLTVISNNVCNHYNCHDESLRTVTCLPVVSTIVTAAVVIVPVVIPGSSEDGTVKLILNVSSPSTMLSSVTGIFTILLLVPAVIVIVCVVELKSFPDGINNRYVTQCILSFD